MYSSADKSFTKSEHPASAQQFVAQFFHPPLTLLTGLLNTTFKRKKTPNLLFQSNPHTRNCFRKTLNFGCHPNNMQSAVTLLTRPEDLYHPMYCSAILTL